MSVVIRCLAGCQTYADTCIKPKTPSEPTATVSVLPVTPSAEELEAGAPLDKLGTEPY